MARPPRQCSEAVADVEGGVVEGRGDRLAVARRHPSGASGSSVRARRMPRRRGTRRSCSPTGFAAVKPSSTSATASDREEQVHRPSHAPVGELAADEVADGHAEADQRRARSARPSRATPVTSVDERRDVAVDGEEPAEADRPDTEREPDLRSRKALSSLATVAPGSPGCHGTAASTATKVEREDRGDHQEGERQPTTLAEPGDERHADHVRDRESRSARTRRPSRACPDRAGSAATSAPMPKYAPCGRPARKRAMQRRARTSAARRRHALKTREARARSPIITRLARVPRRDRRDRRARRRRRRARTA